MIFAFMLYLNCKFKGDQDINIGKKNFFFQGINILLFGYAQLA